MTSKELFEKINDTDFWEDNMSSKTTYAEWKDKSVELIEQAKDEWCRKQRENCCANAKISTAWFKGKPDSIIDANSILNAPKP